jgi:hypothetical protein
METTTSVGIYAMSKIIRRDLTGFWMRERAGAILFGSKSTKLDGIVSATALLPLNDANIHISHDSLSNPRARLEIYKS